MGCLFFFSRFQLMLRQAFRERLWQLDEMSWRPSFVILVLLVEKEVASCSLVHGIVPGLGGTE